MSDIALILNSSGYFDLSLTAASDGLDLARDADLHTAVSWSLFADRRAEPDDPLPPGDADRRGWCLDYLNDDPLGSRLWLLRGAKSHADAASAAEDAADEALLWLITDGVARQIITRAELGSVPMGPDADLLTVLSLNVQILRADSRTWQHIWRMALNG